MHREIPLTVNAWVDEGVAPLFEALNRYHEIVTLESCECGQDGMAFVNFLTHDENDLVSTVKDLARALEGTDLPAVVALEWWYGGTSPGAVIKCTPGEVDTVALMLKQSVSAV